MPFPGSTRPTMPTSGLPGRPPSEARTSSSQAPGRKRSRSTPGWMTRARWASPSRLPAVATPSRPWSRSASTPPAGPGAPGPAARCRPLRSPRGGGPRRPAIAVSRCIARLNETPRRTIGRSGDPRAATMTEPSSPRSCRAPARRVPCRRRIPRCRGSRIVVYGSPRRSHWSRRPDSGRARVNTTPRASGPARSISRSWAPTRLDGRDTTRTETGGAGRG